MADHRLSQRRISPISNQKHKTERCWKHLIIPVPLTLWSLSAHASGLMKSVSMALLSSHLFRATLYWYTTAGTDSNTCSPSQVSGDKRLIIFPWFKTNRWEFPWGKISKTILWETFIQIARQVFSIKYSLSYLCGLIWTSSYFYSRILDLGVIIGFLVLNQNAHSSFLKQETSLVVQWLRFRLLMQGAWIPHASQPKKQNIKQKQYGNKFNKALKKKVPGLLWWSRIPHHPRRRGTYSHGKSWLALNRGYV